MASPCELLVEDVDAITASRLTQLAFNEAKRIEQKFSRYRDDNIIHQINNAKGKTIALDDETVLLLNFADQCYALSDGMFDITSGVLRKVWTFDGSDNIPGSNQVSETLKLVGWQKATLENSSFTLPQDMEIDLGGIGKEYAVDRVFNFLAKETEASFLVNFGGDLRANHQRNNGSPWSVGLENPDQVDTAKGAIQIRQGALATSGDSKRFLIKNGKRYSHVLNPKTGWPVENAPRSITVSAPTATDAGILATFALLQGEGAEKFLKNEDIPYWIIR